MFTLGDGALLIGSGLMSLATVLDLGVFVYSFWMERKNWALVGTGWD
jgi:hypothetical protein